MSGKPIHVLLVSHQSALEGAERSLLDLAIGLREHGMVTTVLLPGPGPLADALDTARIEYFIIPSARWISGRGKRWMVLAPRLIKNVVAWVAAHRRLRGRPIDVVYTNTLASPLGGLLSLSLGKPNVWHIREFVQDGLGASFDWGTRPSMALVERASRRVICNSHALRLAMETYISAERLTTVHNGFLQRNATPRMQPAEPATLCLVGSLVEHKGHVDAVRVLKILADRGRDVRLRIVGTGDDRYASRLRLLAQDLNVDWRIMWDGFVDDPIRTVFPSADIALVCSRCEAFGRVCVEAMAAGCPVIGTRAGGVPEIIEDGKSGLLYEPADATTLSNHIESLLSSRDMYRRFSSEGIARAKDFTLDRYVAGVAMVIRKAAADAFHFSRGARAPLTRRRYKAA